MKWIIALFLAFSGFLCQAQDGYVFTKQQHDEIRKNLQDYKRLIGQFDSLGREFKIMKQNYEFSKALHDNDVIKLQEINIELKKAVVDERKYSDLIFQNERQKIMIENLQHDVLVLNSQIRYQNKTIIRLQTRNARLIDKTRGDRIMEGFVFGAMVGASIIAIWMGTHPHQY